MGQNFEIVNYSMSRSSPKKSTKASQGSYLLTSIGIAVIAGAFAVSQQMPQGIEQPIVTHCLERCLAALHRPHGGSVPGLSPLQGTRHANKPYTNFEQFYPHYQSEHQDSTCRLLHVVYAAVRATLSMLKANGHA